MSQTKTAFEKLSSPELLNLVDELNDIGIQDEVSLPQIIVVGNQSSGKSSVLEAISRLSFPQGSSLTTTFATEIALRKSDTISIRARIIAADDCRPTSSTLVRSKEQREAIAKWNRELRDLDGFGELIKEAQSFILKHSSLKADSFSFDKLRIDASGPDYPLLTLIDLPGLILAPNPGQTMQDVRDAEEIVKGYAENPRSIIIAVLTAETDPANQLSLQRAKAYDPTGSRTIGVITKPDTLQPHDPKVNMLIGYAQNNVQDYHFTHGWFVLKNRSFDATSETLDERDANEESFFGQSNWSAVGHENAGVSKLREKLCRLQTEIIREALPDIMAKIDSKLVNCLHEKEKMGEARITTDQQKFYLYGVTERFQRVVRDAVSGSYRDRSFFRNGSQNEPRELRAAISKLYKSFRTDIYDNGRTWVIVQDDVNVQAEKAKYKADQEILTVSQFLAKIEKNDEDHQDMELPSMVNQYRLVSDLFVEQAQKWERIASRHIRTIFTTVSEHLLLVVQHVASRDTVSRIQSKLVKEAMAEKEQQLTKKLRELVAPYQHWQPITMNHYYQTHVYDRSAPSLQYKIQNQSLEVSQAMEQYALTLNHLETFYQIALLTFIDNVTVLGIEMLLLKDLHEILSPRDVSKMESHTLNFVAAEPLEDQHRRRNIQSRLKKLEQAKQLCDDYLYMAGKCDYPERLILSQVPGLSESPDSPLSLLRQPRTPLNLSEYPGSPKSHNRYDTHKDIPVRIKSGSPTSDRNLSTW